MISLAGGRVHTCEGWTRREWLRAGGLGTLGLSLPGLMGGRAQAALRDRLAAVASPGFGKAKACIVLFLFGAPAHQDAWDLKPEAPAEIRGEFAPIDTNVPGIRIGEHLPRLATLADRYALVRSVTHPDDTHTVAMHYMLSGVRHARPQTNPQNAPDDFPCFGAVVNYVRGQEARERQAPGPLPPGGTSGHRTAGAATQAVPPAISLNSPANQVSANNHIFPGFFAGLLGTAWDPVFVSQPPHDAGFDPFPALTDRARILNRRRLLAEVERQTRALDQSASVRQFDAHARQAFALLTSPGTRRAFDLSREPETLRARYGATPFGQGCLLARRLVEAGVSLVTVNWERDDAYWDTHANNFVQHRDKLLPNLDRGFSALLEDLAARGLLEETLVVCLGEFGRTPKINNAAGRDHWAPCQTVVLAGGGVAGGQVYGASDRHAAWPVRDPVRPEDLSATLYHLLGIDPHRTIPDAEGRPLPLSQGEPVWGLL